MIGYDNQDPDWPGPPTDPPDEDTRWETGGITSTDEDPDEFDDQYEAELREDFGNAPQLPSAL